MRDREISHVESWGSLFDRLWRRWEGKKRGKERRRERGGVGEEVGDPLALLAERERLGVFGTSFLKGQGTR